MKIELANEVDVERLKRVLLEAGFELVGSLLRVKEVRGPECSCGKTAAISHGGKLWCARCAMNQLRNPND